MNNKIPFNKPFIVGKELYNIAQAVISGHLAGDGSFTKACNKWLEDNLICEKALLTHSCTAALEMSAILCDIQPDDEIIMPSFTFVSTANAFVLRGGTPVFVDIRQDTLNIDEKLIEAAITPKTKAIVPVHYAGMPCEMDVILQLAKQYNLIVVEDAAQAFFATYKGKFLGTMGDFGCLSFHETKNVISGEGGALLINNRRSINRAEIVREKGTNRNQFFRGEVDKYTWVDIGSSYLPSEIVSAFLYAQLENADKIMRKRRNLFDSYMRGLTHLEDKGCFRLPFIFEHDVCNGHMIYLLTGSLEERNRLIESLKGRNINAVFHYVPLHSSPAGKRYGRISGSMHVTDDVSDRLVRLPLYYEMTDNDIDIVISAITDFYRASYSDESRDATLWPHQLINFR